MGAQREQTNETEGRPRWPRNTDRRSPRERRASSNAPEEFSDGAVSLGMEFRLDRAMSYDRRSQDLANAGVEEGLGSYNAPYKDGGGVYSR